jgi:hypothetical protein
MFDCFVTFLLAIGAGIVNHYLCKWLDGKTTKERQP